jgi:nucleoside-diphosphate-sugar epimerase
VFPLTAYAASKFAAECALLRLAAEEFWPVSLRFATLFGASPAFRSDILLNRMVGTAVREGVIRVSDPEIRRPLLHVHDAARAIAHVLSAPPPLLRTGLYNVGGTGLNHRLEEVAHVVQQAVPAADIHYEDATTDHRSYTVRFTRFRDAFPAWTPAYGIAEGAAQLVHYYGTAPATPCPPGPGAASYPPATGWGTTDRRAHLLALTAAHLLGRDLRRPAPEEYVRQVSRA